MTDDDDPLDEEPKPRRRPGRPALSPTERAKRAAMGQKPHRATLTEDPPPAFVAKESPPRAPLPDDTIDAWRPLLSMIPRWDPFAQAEGFRFDFAKARHVIDWFENHVHHLTGTRRGELIRLDAWQRCLLANAFGWVHDGGESDGRRRFKKVLLYIGKKNGKALALDTRIPTPTGWSTMGDLRVGDEVFDECGERCRVTFATDVMHGHRCYRVRFSDGTSIVADAEHEWYTDAYRTGRPGPSHYRGRRRGEMRQVFADHIRTTERIRETLTFRCGGPAGTAANHSIPVAGPLAIQPAGLPIPPYTLGVWLGDGTSANANLTCSRKDFGILDGIRSEGVPVADPKFRDARSPDTATVCLSAGRRGVGVMANSIQARLRAMGLLNNKHIPGAYLRASDSQRMALLRGLMDTDGCVSRRGICSFDNTNRVLIDGFVELARSLGFKPMVTEARAVVNGKDCGPTWEVQITARPERSCFSLARKSARLVPRPRGRCRSESRQIVAVDPVESVPVRCIQVDSPSHLYLAGDGMVPTHNTSILGGLAAYAFTALGEGGAKVFTAATHREQARGVFNIARDTIAADPETLAKCVILQAGILLVADTTASLKPLSGDAGAEDGADCFFAILDELHRQKNTHLPDILEGGGAARAEPMFWMLTTAGELGETPCNEERAYAISVRENRGDRLAAGWDPTYLPAVYELDQETAKGDGWTKEENWYAANPGLGTIKSLEFMRALYAKARQKPSARIAFQRFHLNLRVENVLAPIKAESWAKCVGPDPWNVLPEKMRGRPCILGVDLAETGDMVAIALDFYEDGVVVPFFWATEAAATSQTEPLYRRWAAVGALTLVAEQAIEYAPIVEKAVECVALYHVTHFACDPYKMMEFTYAMQRGGLDGKITKVRQNWMDLTDPCDQLVSNLDNGRLRHGGHPVLNWNAQNLRFLVTGQRGKKPQKASASQKIDGLAAYLTARAVRFIAREEAADDPMRVVPFGPLMTGSP